MVLVHVVTSTCADDNKNAAAEDAAAVITDFLCFQDVLVEEAVSEVLMVADASCR